MKLTKKDKQILKNWGHPVEDFEQIQNAARFLVIKDEANKRIRQKQFIKEFGKEMFLSGLSRAAFHWSAERCGYGFDCQRFFMFLQRGCITKKMYTKDRIVNAEVVKILDCYNEKKFVDADSLKKGKIRARVYRKFNKLFYFLGEFIHKDNIVKIF